MSPRNRRLDFQAKRSSRGGVS